MSRRCIRRRRSGYTLIELIVTILVAAVLLALIVPGLLESRGRGRRTRCLSQMRNVSMAMHSYATANNGALPPLYGTELENDADPDNAPYVAGWAFDLLPYLEQTRLHEYLLAADTSTNRDPRGLWSFAQLSATNVQVFTCPDSDRSEQAGALSYVVNTGYMTSDIWDDPTQGHRHQISGTYNWNNGDFDETTPEDAQISMATGALLADSIGQYPTTLDQMALGDGTTQTIMLSENLNAGQWISGNPHEMSFAVRVGGTATDIETSASASGVGSGTDQSALQLPGRFDLGPSCINCDPDAVSAVPRPSSVHNGGVNVFFGDGHGEYVSETIDPGVYARLVTSAGERHGQTLVKDEF